MDELTNPGPPQKLYVSKEGISAIQEQVEELKERAAEKKREILRQAKAKKELEEKERLQKQAENEKKIKMTIANRKRKNLDFFGNASAGKIGSLAGQRKTPVGFKQFHKNRAVDAGFSKEVAKQATGMAFLAGLVGGINSSNGLSGRRRSIKVKPIIEGSKFVKPSISNKPIDSPKTQLKNSLFAIRESHEPFIERETQDIDERFETEKKLNYLRTELAKINEQEPNFCSILHQRELLRIASHVQNHCSLSENCRDEMSQINHLKKIKHIHDEHNNQYNGILEKAATLHQKQVEEATNPKKLLASLDNITGSFKTTVINSKMREKLRKSLQIKTAMHKLVSKEPIINSQRPIYHLKELSAPTSCIESILFEQDLLERQNKGSTWQRSKKGALITRDFDPGNSGIRGTSRTSSTRPDFHRGLTTQLSKEPTGAMTSESRGLTNKMLRMVTCVESNVVNQQEDNVKDITHSQDQTTERETCNRISLKALQPIIRVKAIARKNHHGLIFK